MRLLHILHRVLKIVEKNRYANRIVSLLLISLAAAVLVMFFLVAAIVMTFISIREALS